MALTEAQRERVAANKLQAAAIRDQKALATAAAAALAAAAAAAPAAAAPATKRRKVDAPTPGEGAESDGARRGCENCGAAAVDAQLATFGVFVCAEHRAVEAFDLVSATDAARDYLLPQSLFKTLKCCEKPNPRSPNWQPMKLYLRRDLIRHSLERWGSDVECAAWRHVETFAGCDACPWRC
ncbi:hypothetical protein M885DRAFT_519429 [Pelagophyceae sp. CCMP2097]|nr:hypothetical protein M885DRAFT_519429 [Pelagophyceae sp. CCMP2097]